MDENFEIDNNEGRELNDGSERQRQNSGPGVLLRTLKPGNEKHRPTKGDRYVSLLTEQLKGVKFSL